jgi:hypothetical protein
MTIMNEQAKQRTDALIDEIARRMHRNVDIALESDAIDTEEDAWDEEDELPKIIAFALLHVEIDSIGMRPDMKATAFDLIDDVEH